VPSTRRRFLERVGVATLALAAGCSTQPETDGQSTDGTAPTPTAEPSADPTPTPTPVGPLEGSWRSYRADAANTAAVDASGPRELPATYWKFVTATGRPTTAAVGVGGAAVYATDTPALVARDAVDGSVRWRRPLPGAATADPVAVDGTGAVAADGTLVGFAADSGADRWSSTLDGPVQGLTTAEGRIVAATDGAVVGLSASEGTVQWRHAVEGRVATPPEAAGGTVAVGLASGDVVALRAGTDDEAGTPRWRTTVAAVPAFAPAVTTEQVYVATETDVTALDTATGERAWTVAFPAAGAPVATEAAVYVTALNDDAAPPESDAGSGAGTTTATPPPTDTMYLAVQVESLAPADGSTQWRARLRDTYNFTSGPPATVPLAVAGERVVVDVGGDLTAFDAAGTERWSAPGAGTGSPPAAVGDVVSSGLAGVVTEDGHVRWRFEAGAAAISDPVVVGNDVYVGSDDQYLYALTANTGDPRWVARTDGRIRSSPAVDDDTAYVGTDTGSLYAFDRTDGTERWRTEIGGQVQPPTLWEGTLYVGTFSPTVYAVDAADGTREWTTTRDDPFLTGVPAVADGVVVAGNNGDLRGFDAADGTELWAQSPGGDGMAVQSTPAIADGRVFVNLGDAVRAFELADGSELWSVRTGGSNRPPVVDDGTVYASGENGLVAVEAATGSRQWRTDGTRRLDLTVGAEAIFAVGDDRLFAIDRATGDSLWGESGLPGRTAPVPAGELLFVGDDAGRLRALGPPR
jgi:outer membrane protein assembly factor BamB